MARPVITEITEINGFGIINHYSDGTTDENTFYEGDIIEEFKFADNNEYTKMTGKVKSVVFDDVRRFPTKKYVSDITTTKNLGSVDYIIFDGSTQYNAAQYKVDDKSILEYSPTKEVSKVKIFANNKVKLKVVLSDESYSEAVLYEGMTLSNVTLQRNGSDITGSFKLVSFFYDLEKSKIKMVGMYLVGDAGSFKVSFYDIKKVGTESFIASTDDFDNALSEAYSGSGNLLLNSGVIEDAVSLTSDINIIGNNFSLGASSGDRRTDEISENETVFKGKFTFSQNSNITISGVTFTENSKLDLNGASSLTLRNCKFTNIAASDNKTYMIVDSSSRTNSLLLQIENCYFGTNTITDTNKMYNLFEINAKLKDGSYIKNCYFAKEVCSHNIINIYDVEDNANILIEDNHFELSMNACRIGTKGSPNNVNITFNNNTYDETDTNANYAGLLIIQPYATATTSMSGITVNLNRTKFTGDGHKQLYYIHIGDNDTDIRGDKSPNVFINGVKQKTLIYDIG